MHSFSNAHLPNGIGGLGTSLIFTSRRIFLGERSHFVYLMVGARSHQTGRSVFKALCCDGDGCIVVVVKYTCVGRAGCAVAAVGPLRGGCGSGQTTALLAMRWCLLVD